MQDMPTPLEDKFILHWRAASNEGRLTTLEMSDYPALNHLAWTVFVDKLLLYWADAPWTDLAVLAPTPRGEDLLATADAIGYDPTAPKPNEPVAEPVKVECPKCKGRGRVSISSLGSEKSRGMKELIEGSDGRENDPTRPEVLAGWDLTCPRCKGVRAVAPQAPKLRNAINAMFQGQGRVTVAVDPAGGVSFRPAKPTHHASERYIRSDHKGDLGSTKGSGWRKCRACT